MSVRNDYVLPVSSRRVAVLDLVTFRPQDHEQDSLLDIVASLHQFITSLVDHVGGEENEDSFCYRHRDDLVLGVVPIKVHHSKYLGEQFSLEVFIEYADSLEDS